MPRQGSFALYPQRIAAALHSCGLDVPCLRGFRSRPKRTSGGRGIMFLYVIVEEPENWDIPICKIGVTHNIDNRLSQLQVGNPRELICKIWVKFPNSGLAKQAEEIIHERLSLKCQQGEWFKISVANADVLIRRLFPQTSLNMRYWPRSDREQKRVKKDRKNNALMDKMVTGARARQ